MTHESASDYHVSMITKESQGLPKMTIYQMIRRRVRERPDFVVMKYKSSPKSDQFDKSITIAQSYQLLMKAAKSLLKIGLKPQKSMCIMGFNSPEWVISEVATTFTGGLSVAMYSSNSAEECDYIMTQAECQILILQDRSYLDRLRPILDRHRENLLSIVLYGEIAKDQTEYMDMIDNKIPVYSWLQFMEIGADLPDKTVEEVAGKMNPDDGCFLVYTSGTTGRSKGVIASHDNVIFELWMITKSMGYDCYTNKCVSYLPLSHVLGKYELIFGWYMGMTIHFAQPDALKGSLGKTLREAKPTHFITVPRILEKIQENIVTGASENRKNQSQLKNVCQDALVSFAKKSGLKNAKRKLAGKSTDWTYGLANRILFKRVRALLGLDNCEKVISTAAPLSLKTFEFFLSLDIIVMPVYGMTECSGLAICNTPFYNCPGSIGAVGVGGEAKLDAVNSDGEGEICLRSRSVFKGYWKDAENTSVTIDKDGWLHTGDLGTIKTISMKTNGVKSSKKEISFFFITGRIKELLITSGGENIAPVPMEEKIKENLSYISNAVLIGNQQKFISCLLTLKVVIDPDSLEPSNKLTGPASVMLSKVAGKSITTADKVIESVENDPNSPIEQQISRAISLVNENAISNAAKIKKWKIIPTDFSVPGGEIGSTMKLKRAVIYKRYSKEIEALYE